jgi:hypothetical protein
MKKLLFITILLISNILIGQEERQKFKIYKGLWNIEGNISLDFGNTKNYEPIDYNLELKSFNFRFSPKLGYSINDNLIIGIGLGYHYYKSEGETYENFNNNRTINGYSFYPYLKKYIPIGKKLAFHIQGEARFSNDFYKSENRNTKFKNNSIFIGLRPGISYNLSKEILFQANFGALGYYNGTTKTNDIITNKSNSFNFNFSSSELLFGLTVFL